MRSHEPPWLVTIRYVAYFGILFAFAVGAPTYYLVALVSARGTSPSARRKITRATIHKGTTLLFHILRITGVLRVQEETLCSADQIDVVPGVIVANHPSMLDALFFVSRHPQIVCVMKTRLLRWPIIGGFARRAGYLPFDETPELWRCAKEACDEGTSILVFPEGTRSPVGGLHQFKRGAARIAAELDLPLIPYALQMEPVALGRARPWWKPPGKQIRLRVTRLPIVASTPDDRASEDTTAHHMPLDNRRESIRLTESLEVLINSSLFSSAGLS
jgi:1-acyl-sn-glycerol-3-phosphate acyltransferase